MFVRVSCECGKNVQDEFFRRVVPPDAVEAKCLGVRKELTNHCIDCDIARQKAKTKPKKSSRPVSMKGEAHES